MKTLLFLLLALIPRDYYAEAEEQYYESQYAQAIKTALEGASQPDIADSTAVELWSILGASYSRLGAFDKAAEYMILCYEYEKKAGDAAGLTSSLINLASMYVYAGKGELAEDYALEAIANEERIGRPAKLAMARREKRSAKRLQQSNRQKDFLFKVISHDLQSPAVAQLRGMQLLRGRAGKMSADELSRVFLQLEQQAASEVELIENVLRWARTQGEQQSCEGVPFVLNDLVKEVMAQYDGGAKIKDISLVLEAPERAVVVCSNRSNLMLALRNLLSNAVKFSPRGETVRIVITPSADGASLTVADNGIGIPADKVEGIFQADAAFRRSGTDGEPSNGLGLAVSRKLLEEAGCSLSVESTEGKGSAFTIGIHNLEYNA